MEGRGDHHQKVLPDPKVSVVKESQLCSYLAR
jgi:hypothetical protein